RTLRQDNLASNGGYLMKQSPVVILIICLAAFAALYVLMETDNMTTLQTSRVAPELNNTVWLNTETPLHLADLRGSVVLLEFWTFDCINCIRTIPYVQRWHETYANQGLTVIGNHFPEYDYERDLDNLRAAASRLGITYPIAQDNDGATWRAYR